MKISKTSIVLIILIVWAVFSIFWMGKTSWEQFKINKLNIAAQQGYQQAILDVAAEVNKCADQAVPLNVGKDKDGKDVTVGVVGLSCLQKAQNDATKAAEKTPATPKK